MSMRTIHRRQRTVRSQPIRATKSAREKRSAVIP
jgi:hypothetical protein